MIKRVGKKQKDGLKRIKKRRKIRKMEEERRL